MYRILAADQPVRERRNQREHPQYTKPELVATAPNQTWSWDITKLLVSTKWTYFYLYVVLDIFSRYAVGWMVADRENSALAGRLIEETCHNQGVQPQVLTLHSAVSNTSRSNTPGAWPKPGSILRSAASATATTTRWPKRSTASTRPRRSTGAARGDRSRPSNTPPSNGWTGSIINACSAPSATSRPQRPKQITMPPARTSIWLHDSNVTASGKAGAVQTSSRPCVSPNGLVSVKSSLTIAFAAFSTVDMNPYDH